MSTAEKKAPVAPPADPLTLSGIPVRREYGPEDLAGRDLAADTGRRIVDMVWEDLKPRDFVNAESIDNAITTVLALGGSTNSAETEEALAVLKSRSFSESFIREEGVLAKLYPKLWDPSQNQWRAGADRQPTLARGSKYFSSKIMKLGQEKKTGLS